MPEITRQPRLHLWATKCYQERLPNLLGAHKDPQRQRRDKQIRDQLALWTKA